MIIFPAIDIRDGKCVRLTRVVLIKKQFLPIMQIWQYAGPMGAEYLHLVDLDGALAGKPVNMAAITKL